MGTAAIQSQRSRYSLCLLLGLLVCLATPSQAKQQSVAMFQFTATSMDVVGVENDVAYVLRNELRKNNQLTLLNQREMEVVLVRNQIVQGYDVDQAIKAALVLDVNFVVIGQVSKKNSQIVSNLALIAAANKQQIAQWEFSFANQQDVLNRGREIGTALISAIEDMASSSGHDGASLANDWLLEIGLSHADGQSKLKWQVAKSAPESLGFNVYRGTAQQGPFSYVASVLDPEFVDDVTGLSGRLFYQLSLLSADGEEYRSARLGQLDIEKQVESSLAPPAILTVNQLLKGIEITFLPSAQNIDKKIQEYQLVRREPASSWQVVNRLGAGLTGQNNSSQIQQYTLNDPQAANVQGPVEYAVRAVSANESGNLSNIFSHTPATAPELLNTGEQALRKAILRWQPVNAGEGYHIFRREPQSQTQWQNIATLNDIKQSSFIDSDFSRESQSFEYAIQVYDRYSTSDLSAALLLSSRGPLPAPTNFVLQSNQARKVTLTWTPFEDAGLKGYAIFRAPFTNSTDVKLQKIAEVLDTQGQSYVDGSIETDQASFYYAVAALNSFGTSGDLSPLLKATTKAAPKSVAAFSATVVEQTIQLTWQPPDNQGVASYQIARRWQAGNWQLWKTVDGQQTSIVDQQLLPEATVEYQMVLIDDDNLSSQPLVSDALVSPAKFTFITQDDGLLRQVNLQWKPVGLAERLILNRRLINTEWQVIAELDGSVSDYTDSKNLADGSDYEYKLQVVYAAKVVAESPIINMKTKEVAPPGDLQVVSGLPRQIEVRWARNQDPDLKSHLVYRASKDDNYSVYKFLTEIPSGQTPQFIDVVQSGGIQHGEVYRYALASRNTFDALGPLSPFVEGASKPLPSAPMGLQAQADTSWVTLSWQTSANQDLQSVEIYQRLLHENSWHLVDTIHADSNVYQDVKLLPYANLVYKIRLIDKDGLASADSSEVKVLSPLTIKLEAPEQGLLRKSKLVWSVNDLVESYIVLRSQDGNNWQELATLTSHNYTDENKLDDQTQYFYRVAATYGGHVLGHSNTVDVRTKDLPLPPDGITVQNGLVKKVSLSWQAHSDPDIAGYIIYRQESNGKWAELSTLKLAENEFVDEGGFFSKLENGVTYHYLVSAFNRFKVEGPKSQVFSATTKAIPDKVEGLKAELIAGQVRLSWQFNPQTDIVQYQIFRGKTCSRASELTAVDGQTNSFADTDLGSATEFCYYLTAKDADGLESLASQSVSLTF